MYLISRLYNGGWPNRQIPAAHRTQFPVVPAHFGGAPRNLVNWKSMPTKDEVMHALEQCFDPEIPVNIVDLGLIYDVRFTPVSDGAATDVEVEMTMTSPGCPSHVGISEDVRRKILELPGVNIVNVNVVWTPPWSPERLSPAAREKLGIE